MALQLKQSPRFVLVGIYGLYNYGCEAIVRGTIQILRREWPNCRIVLATRSVERDRKVLNDIEKVQIVQSHKRWTWKRLIFGVMRRLGHGVGSPQVLSRSLHRYGDVVLSVGGDNYAMVGDQPGPLLDGLRQLGDETIRQRKTFVIWGASVGPFDRNPRIEQEILRHLNDISLIMVRERRSYQYLQNLGCRAPLALAADPAFVVQASQSNIAESFLSKRTENWAINLSPLCIAHAAGFETPSYSNKKTELFNSIKKVMLHRDVRLILVPHVVNSNEIENDDYRFLNELKIFLGDEERCVLLPPDLGFQNTKSVISKCDIAVAARMHFGVSAVSAGVPTLFIRYSIKSIGMAEKVYGDSDWCVDIEQIDGNLFCEKLLEMDRAKNTIRDQIKLKLPMVVEEAYSAIVPFRDIVQN